MQPRRAPRNKTVDTKGPQSRYVKSSCTTNVTRKLKEVSEVTSIKLSSSSIVELDMTPPFSSKVALRRMTSVAIDVSAKNIRTVIYEPILTQHEHNLDEQKAPCGTINDDGFTLSNDIQVSRYNRNIVIK
jgi:hypothetical protein